MFGNRNGCKVNNLDDERHARLLDSEWEVNLCRGTCIGRGRLGRKYLVNVTAVIKHILYSCMKITV